MTTSNLITPQITRAGALRLGVLASVAAGLLLAAPLASGPARPADLASGWDEVSRWWDHVGTPMAVVVAVRIAAFSVAVWVMASSLLAMMALTVRSAIGVRIAWRLTPQSLRRMLAASVVVAVSAPSLAAGADPAERDAPVLIDLGPADEHTESLDVTPLLTDIGPVDPSPRPWHLDQHRPPVEGALDDVETWRVQAGDHLWLIAQDTLTDHGQSPSENDVTRYWDRLIDANQDAIGDDPDLIYPGMELQLPAVPG